ncbi:unnamed protein product [Nezara viridula]|uniref:Uncharacterized protein n=1 Tax=Nezara viridula TaxID=85310 RepID=A0A9P0HL79_NEZVI|nr:unnamed protein product [Nezara viridula]
MNKLSVPTKEEMTDENVSVCKSNLSVSIKEEMTDENEYICVNSSINFSDSIKEEMTDENESTCINRFSIFIKEERPDENVSDFLPHGMKQEKRQHPGGLIRMKQEELLISDVDPTVDTNEGLQDDYGEKKFRLKQSLMNPWSKKKNIIFI